MVRVVEPVASVEERFFWLGKERPRSASPERFTFFLWPHSVRYFEESGLGEMIRHRVYPLGFEQVGAEMAAGDAHADPAGAAGRRSTRSTAATTTRSGSAKTSV